MKKSLLTESEIRKFMKFANITPLTENFLDRVQEEVVSEEEVVAEEETVTEESVTEEEVVAEEAVAEEVVAEETLAEGEVDEEALVRALVAAIMDHTDADITVQGAEDEVPADDSAEEMDLDLADDDEELALDAPDAEGEEGEEEEDDIPSDLVEAITRRVAARLLNESRK